MWKGCFKNDFLITICAGPEIITLQLSYMFSDNARTYVVGFKSMSVKKLFNVETQTSSYFSIQLKALTFSVLVYLFEAHVICKQVIRIRQQGLILRILFLQKGHKYENKLFYSLYRLKGILFSHSILIYTYKHEKIKKD